MLNHVFQKLQISEEELKKELREKTSISKHQKGEFLIKENKYIKVLKIVISGKVRVYQENEEREILIYYLGDMETCTLSLSACFEDCKSTVNAIVEEESIVLNIPVRFVKDWCFTYKSWNRFTINTFRDSYNVLINNYSKLAFNPLRERLLEYLMIESNNSVLQRSHQQLARELATTREVVSRLLKKLETEGIVALGKQEIRILKKST